MHKQNAIANPPTDMFVEEVGDLKENKQFRQRL